MTDAYQEYQNEIETIARLEATQAQQAEALKETEAMIKVRKDRLVIAKAVEDHWEEKFKALEEVIRADKKSEAECVAKLQAFFASGNPESATPDAITDYAIERGIDLEPEAEEESAEESQLVFDETG